MKLTHNSILKTIVSRAIAQSDYNLSDIDNWISMSIQIQITEKYSTAISSSHCGECLMSCYLNELLIVSSSYSSPYPFLFSSSSKPISSLN